MKYDKSNIDPNMRLQLFLEVLGKSKLISFNFSYFNLKKGVHFLLKSSQEILCQIQSYLA